MSSGCKRPRSDYYSESDAAQVQYVGRKTTTQHPMAVAMVEQAVAQATADLPQAMNETCIDARHVVHLSLSEGLDFSGHLDKVS
jgi:hypothetical protein